MEALVIAAGDGTRMGNGIPKVLLEINGITLLEHHINSLKSLGVKKIHLVLGYKKDEVIDFLKRKKLSSEVNVIYNPHWEKGNAYSILAAKDYIDGPFILVMGDHYYNPESIKGLLQINADFVIVVDSEPRYIDIDEATKIKVKNGRVADIGKNLTDFDAVDAGIFLLSPSVFGLIEDVIRKGGDSWNDVKREWIKRKSMTLYDIKGAIWYDIDTPEDLKKINEILKAKAFKKARDGIVSRYLNRTISKRISKLLVKTPLTPNMITLISFFLGITGGFFFAFGSRWALIVGGLLVQLSSIIDGCDGEVARLKKLSTKYGAFFDSVLDRVADGVIIFGMACGFYRMTGDFYIWPLSLFALLGTFLVSYTESRYESLFKRPLVRTGEIPAKRDTRLFLCMLAGLFNIIPFILAITGLLGFAESIRRLFLALPEEN